MLAAKECIERLRLLGLSEKEIADRVGYKQGAISSIVRGRIKDSRPLLVKKLHIILAEEVKKNKAFFEALDTLREEGQL